MPTMQEFLADATIHKAADLAAALNSLPEDKRNWTPMGDARTALDQVAECAIMNGGTADIIRTKKFLSDFSMESFAAARKHLSDNPDAMHALLKENTEKLAAVLRETTDEELDAEVQMPWGPMTIGQICAYPLWNMGYHDPK
jgi:hypothetical protein